MKLVAVLLVFLVSCSRPVAPGLVVALLALRTGANCTEISAIGKLQLANLKAIVRESNTVNRQSLFKTELIALDTCASPKMAVKMALRGLVIAEDTGLMAPHFLGFLGPYDWDSLQAVAPITKIFGLTHVVPYARGPRIENAMAVIAPDWDHTALGVTALLKTLRWAAVLLVPAGGGAITERVISLASEAGICVMMASLQFPDAIRQGADSAAGVIVLTDKLRDVPSVNATLLVLVLESDEAHAYGLSLMTAAGHMVRRNMTSHEWSSALRSTTAFRRGTKLQFGMEQTVQVLLRLPGEKSLRKVGDITGEEVVLEPDLHIPVVNTTSCLVPTEDHGFYTMVGTMTGIGAGLLLCLILGIYMVHTTFKAASDSDS